MIKISELPISSKVDEKPWKTHVQSKYIQLIEPCQRGMKTSRTKRGTCYSPKYSYLETAALLHSGLKPQTALCFMGTLLSTSLQYFWQGKSTSVMLQKLCSTCCKKKGAKVWKMMFIQLLYKKGLRKRDAVWDTEIKVQNVLKIIGFFLGQALSKAYVLLHLVGHS